MSRVTSAVANSSPVIDQDMPLSDVSDLGDAIDSAASAPDLFQCGKGHAFSDRKLERLGRRFGFPDTFLGTPLINVTTCLERASYYVDLGQFVSAKKVLELGLNNAMSKTSGDAFVLKDMLYFVERLKAMHEGTLSLGSAALRVNDDLDVSSGIYFGYGNDDLYGYRSTISEVDLYARAFALEDSIATLKSAMTAKYTPYKGLESLEFANMWKLNIAIQKQLDHELTNVRSFLSRYFPGYSN